MKLLLLLVLSTTVNAQVFNGNFEQGRFDQTYGWSYVKTISVNGSIRLVNKTAPACVRCSSDRAMRINVSSVVDQNSIFMPINFGAYRQRVTPGTTRNFYFQHNKCYGSVRAAIRYWNSNGTKTFVLLPYYPSYSTAWLYSPVLSYVVPNGAVFSSPGIIYLGGTGSCEIDNLIDWRLL